MVDADFSPDADVHLPSAPTHGFGRCDCRRCGADGAPRQPARRLFTGLIAAGGALALSPAWAQEGVDVGKQSRFTKLVSAEQVEAAAQQQYEQIKKFVILDHDFSQETGEMTPSLKVKRNVVNEKYAPLFDELYTS